MGSAITLNLENQSPRRPSRPFVLALLLAGLTLFPLSVLGQLTPAPTPAARFQSEVATRPDGLQVVTFRVPQGRIVINLPDDIHVGETISGTVLADPAGGTNEESAKNLAELNRYVFDLGGIKLTPARPLFTWKPAAQGDTAGRHVIRIVEAMGSAVPAELAALAAVTTAEVSAAAPSPLADFGVPAVGQAGRNMVIAGPFDGNGANTIVSATPSPATPSAKPAALFLIAESPRKAVLQCPTTITGPIQLTIKDGGKTKTAPFRNVGILLSALKTSLSQGEQTTLTVEVIGLQGMTSPVSVSLKTIGSINIAGGADQQFSIDPREVAAAGTYTTTRLIVGALAGSFNVNASVITTAKP